MTIVVRKAERRKAKLRCAMIGVSGSGKTYSSLMIAKGLGGKVCIIDTENRSADLYANSFDYDVVELSAPFTPESYVEAIKHIESLGYETIIIDSLSHAWSGEGGILSITDNIAKSSNSKNTYTAWKESTPRHNLLVNAILQSKCNIIATMRSKTHYDIQENDKGRKVPVKVGLSPVQRDGMEYEFTMVLDINQNHYCTASKDRTGIFKDPFIASEDTGKELMRWLNDGKSDEDVLKDELKILMMDFQKFEDDLNSSKDLRELKSSYIAIVKKFKIHSEKHAEVNQFLGEMERMKDEIKIKLESTDAEDELVDSPIEQDYKGD